MSSPAVKSTGRKKRQLHPLPLRIMHWINALAIFIMIGSGWRIYNDDVLFGWLRFPDFLVIGKWAQYGLQWHFFGMWIFGLNGLVYLTYGIFTGRFRQKLFPISPREVLATAGDALRLRLRHEDLTVYNAVQKSLYLGVMLVGVLIVITGLTSGSRCSFRSWRTCSEVFRPSASFISCACRPSWCLCLST